MNLKVLGKNKTEIDLGNGHRILFSYNTPVAESFVTPEGRVYRMTSNKWSATTTRHIKSWMPTDNAQMLSQDYFDDLLSGTTRAEMGGF